MNRCFCRCGRKHRWVTDRVALCPCGEVAEPQTEREIFKAEQAHKATLCLILERNQPALRLRGSE